MRLLVVSPDIQWMQYLQLDLKGERIDVLGLRTAAEAVAAVRESGAGPFDAALISAASAPGRSQDEGLLDAILLVQELRGLGDANLRVLLWSPLPAGARQLARLCASFPNTSILPDDEPSTIAALLRSKAAPDPRAPRWAAVELEIDGSEIHVRIEFEGEAVIRSISQPWLGRLKLKRLEEKFRKWRLWQTSEGNARYTDGWLDTFRDDGGDLADEMGYAADKLQEELAACVSRVGSIDNIHFRFSLLMQDAHGPHPFSHVPFELLYDTAKDNFLRALAPVARRIRLHRHAMNVGPRSDNAAALPLTGPVLFVKSDAHGSQKVDGMSFAGGKKLSLNPLQALDEEFREMQIEWSKAEPSFQTLEPVNIAEGEDSLNQLREALSAEPPPGKPHPQILHYAGHSVRADDSTVWLVLPGSQPGRFQLLPVSDFANWARHAGMRLVVLSSCESTTPDAVFRLAQEGIPAVVGFRWEVEDEEAAFFTSRLHRGLASGVSLARAFHAAVRDLRSRYTGSPTFASPMLVVQDDVWAN